MNPQPIFQILDDRVPSGIENLEIAEAIRIVWNSKLAKVHDLLKFLRKFECIIPTISYFFSHFISESTHGISLVRPHFKSKKT